ncbi:C4-dicarboxylate TRAP transporter substrate-binding protein [Acuticoccus mangrovi]|uniref:C4-dicarboxylate TRAP transporter substrate-binding protein n=1 Tax=Acuticoccus mangrovi TaxID=2796142 RepID=A0A934INW3_9HYPH|nr:C4-dicarboxylate TRAP transporter substrate-binding protein [Acuticoccus mangrovi]MBJ3775350.1 C4-dicarboxylate TRAP transporter substrate-binding protein [Acuticoccus mangrovi]
MTMRCALLSALVLLPCGPGMAADVNLTYGAYGAPNSTLVEYGVIPFLETAKAESGGSIDYTLHAGGALVGPSTTLAGIRDGLVDGGQLLAVYNPAELPTINLAMGLGPGLDTDPVALGAAVTEFALLECPKCLEEFEEANIQFLGGYSSSAYSLLCSEPMASLEDLAGKRVRAAGVWGQLAAKLGMVPVNLTIGETYEGLQRGQLSCTFGTPGWLETFSMGDVAPNVYLLEYGYSFSGPITNVRLDLWTTLTEEQKNALKKGAAIAVIRASEAYRQADADILKDAEAKGYHVVEADSASLAALDGFTDELTQSIIARAADRGQEGAEEVITRFRKVLAKWEGIVAEAEGDEAVLVDRLMSDVYAKVD